MKKQKNLWIAVILLFVSFIFFSAFASEETFSYFVIKTTYLASIVLFVASVVYMLRSIFLKESWIGFFCMLILELIALIELVMRGLWINPFS